MDNGIDVDARNDHTEYFNHSASVETTQMDKQELPKLPKLKVLAAFDSSPNPSADLSSSQGEIFYLPK